MAKEVESPIVLCRMGWSEFYTGEEQLVGGGKYNDNNQGFEAENFLPLNGQLYGYCESRNGKINFERISPDHSQDDVIDRVSVYWIATHPRGGQRLVGWYKNAKIHRSQQRLPKKYREGGWHATCRVDDAVLLPLYARVVEIPMRVKGGFGQSHLRYLYSEGGEPAIPDWFWDIHKFAGEYQGENLLENPVADRLEELCRGANVGDSGQGFGLSGSERKAVEKHAVDRAVNHFERQGYKVDSSPQDSKPYDLLCQKGMKKVTVEVKGTIGKGRKVFLTRNEVKHAQDSSGAHALVVVFDIKLDRGQSPRASGGSLHVIDPLLLESMNISPVHYELSIPQQ